MCIQLRRQACNVLIINLIDPWFKTDFYSHCDVQINLKFTHTAVVSMDWVPEGNIIRKMNSVLAFTVVPICNRIYKS